MDNQSAAGQIVEGVARSMFSLAQRIQEVDWGGEDIQKLFLVAERIRLVMEGMRLWDWVERASNQTGFLPYRTVPFDVFYRECGDRYYLFCSRVSNYYKNHQQDILHSIKLQITTLEVARGPKATLQEAIQAHRDGLFRLTCRGLLPDIERVIYEDWLGENGVGQVKDWKIEKAIKEKCLEDLTPDNWFNLVLFNLLINHLYKNGSNIKHFQEKPFPNRHAALHGWLDYPSEEDSLNAIIFADYIFRLSTSFKESIV